MGKAAGGCVALQLVEEFPSFVIWEALDSFNMAQRQIQRFTPGRRVAGDEGPPDGWKVPAQSLRQCGPVGVPDAEKLVQVIVGVNRVKIFDPDLERIGQRLVGLCHSRKTGFAT